MKVSISNLSYLQLARQSAWLGDYSDEEEEELEEYKAEQ